MRFLKWIKLLIKFCLTREKFLAELHLRLLGFTYSVCKKSIRYCEGIQKFKETVYSKCLYMNELDKACFAHDDGHSGSKHLAERNISGKVLKDRAFKIATNFSYDRY